MIDSDFSQLRNFPEAHINARIRPGLYTKTNGCKIQINQPVTGYLVGDVFWVHWFASFGWEDLHLRVLPIDYIMMGKHRIHLQDGYWHVDIRSDNSQNYLSALKWCNKRNILENR